MSEKLKCILLVDDDDDCNFFHKRLIAKLDCAEHVEVCTNGIEALEYLTQRMERGYPRPELIFLDINMPKMNGWEFLEKYKTLDPDQKAEMLVVMLTTSLNPDDRSRADSNDDVHAFANKYLDKSKLQLILEKNFPQLFSE
ncbi:response regulator [Marinoscillum furvescens]|uniref:Response regulator receiver domain-containing protein n=1 Tax=Marinoscillum furvescens DSM 4134 TaxID=1122208 RepID=A0A3D9L395_MARFU|nr:response regulator [Marinoscillum furvescens]RED97430.1 response regulator receiver domain-containing protein [Marinoscillum furvescens DSM 4134]